MLVGIANSLANLASFYGNYFWLDKYQPDYKESWGTVIAFLVLALVCIVALRYSLSRSNKKFEMLAYKAVAGELDSRGLTEEEHRAINSGFRFVI